MTLLSRIKGEFKQVACAIFMVLCAVLIWMGDSSQAYADSTFLLQLGSYNSEAQASQKWDEIKSKNADLVGSLNLHVAEVALPPDNAIGYRTQAGPIGSHDQAATICSALQSRGVECNVVETALFTAADVAPAPTPTPAASSAPIAAPVPPAPTSAPVTPAPPPTVTLSAPPPPLPPVAATPPPVPAPQPQPQAMAAPVMPVTANVASVPVSYAAPAPRSYVPVVTPSGYVAGQEPKFLNGGGSTYVPPAPSYNAPMASSPMSDSPAMYSSAAAGSTPSPQPAHGFLYRMIHGSSDTQGNPNAVGQVNVSEAIRVPLSSGMPQNHSVVQHLPAVHGLGGSPSVNTSKSLWAQISYFTDENAAREFYDDFASSYPQFSDGVRVRITRPYLNSSEAGHVSLRVGPFASGNAVNTICTAAAARKVSCTLVRDLSTSTANYTTRSRTLDHSYEAPTPAANAETPMMYWVQLGSYRSSNEAWDEWKNLQESQKKLLSHLQATVTNPSMSSSTRIQYRLRAGPFMNESAADNLCNTLSGIGASNCIVVNDR